MSATPTIGSFILTFDRPDALRTTIERMLAQTVRSDLLAVVDNGTSGRTREVAEAFAADGVRYVSTGENLGSAGGTAFGMEWIIAQGFDWAHSIDDDDPPHTLDMVQRLRALIDRQDDGRLGAVAAVGSRWNWKTGTYARIPDGELHGDVEVNTIGGNAHFTVSREVIETIGPPDRRLFFGFYDPLYSLTLGQAGWRLMIDGDLAHQFRAAAGRLDLHRRRSWRPQDPYHAVWRRYYVTRNYIHYMRLHLGRPDLARREAARTMGRAVSSWARGPAYGARYTVLALRGIVDGYSGRLGRRVEPVAKPAG
jgi:GT2 family glycosyltransferase